VCATQNIIISIVHIHTEAKVSKLTTYCPNIGFMPNVTWTNRKTSLGASACWRKDIFGLEKWEDEK